MHTILVTLGMMLANIGGFFGAHQSPSVGGFQPISVPAGGTGVTGFTADSILYANHAGTALAYAATSTLNIGGNAGTATALASTPTKCSAGNYPLGIDVSGNAQNCTSASGGGTVTAVSVASANGFAGSSSGGATPALTISTSITGLLKGNGTAISAAALTDFPTQAANTVIANATGATAAPTAVATSSLYTYSAGLTQASGLQKQIENRSFSYATSTAYTGTTTIPLEVGYGEVWNTIKCYTNTGTLNVQFGYGTASTTMFNASTTIGTVTATPNNTMTSGNSVVVDIGTPASSPTKITCTINDII